ncbi:MAG: MraY family glycosyltransferase [Nitrospiraceae bacterium]|nr:MraY family glycosyltransferase [Nitrospiraceae bacterium]
MLAPIFFSFVISFAGTMFFRKIALFAGAVDMPGGRHIHKSPVPKLGGAALALGVYPAVLIFLPLSRTMVSIIMSSLLMLGLGIYDDMKQAGWKLKTAVSLLAIFTAVFYGGLRVKGLGDLFGTGPIPLGPLELPFTCLAIFGAVNAINLMDGLDGLLAGILVLSLTGLAVLGSVSGDAEALFLSLVLMGAVLGFLPANFPRARMFLGDSGSLFAGFLIAALSIHLANGASTIKPVTPALVLFLPLYDTLRVMTVRLLKGWHPFGADRRHLHHLIVRSDTPARSAVLLLWAVSALAALAAVLFRDMPSWGLLICWTLFAVLMSAFVASLESVKKSRGFYRTARGHVYLPALARETGAFPRPRQISVIQDQ